MIRSGNAGRSGWQEHENKKGDELKAKAVEKKIIASHGKWLRDADLSGADLRGAYLDKTYYQIVRIGSRNATTTYCVEKDNVVCGCWNNHRGGTLEEFKKRVESVYGENGKTPNKKYYGQYIAAIEFFEKMAKLAKKEKEK